MPKPTLFVGSSTEGLEFARAVRARLYSDAEIQLWDEGFVLPGDTIVETLLLALPRFDFAILVLTPDDLLLSREKEIYGPRDNVVFELGLFMGRLGRHRTFLVHQTNTDVKIPSDLKGITLAGYEWSGSKKNYQQAVGPACDKIRNRIQELGAVDRTPHPSWVNFLSQWAFDSDERSILRKLISDDAFIIDVKTKPQFEHKLRHLADSGLARRKKNIGPFFARDAKNDRVDAKEILEITEYGKQFIALYDKSKEAPPLSQWIEDLGFRPN
jgi:hypothetical protein